MQENSRKHLSTELQQFFASGKLKPTNTDGAYYKEINETAPPDDQMSENVTVRAICEKAFRGHYNVEIQPQCSYTGLVSETSVVEEKAGSKHINLDISDNKIGNMNQNFNHTGNIIYNVNGPVQHENVLKKREPINNVTLPINTFTGRETELEELKRLFHIDKYKVVALVGMGGLGKTQLARAFVKENESGYNDRYWVDAETTEQLLASFDRLAKKLKIEPNHDAETVHETYRSFKDGPALIIFDNVPDINTVYTYLPTRIDLSDITVQVLVTSRWRGWRNDHETRSLKLEPLGVEDSLHLFRKLLGDDIYKQEDEETWKVLIKIFDYLPLALQLTAMYIKNQYKFNTKFTINNYMNQVKNKTTEMYNKLLTKTIPDYEENQPVFVAIVMTLKLLEKMHSKLVVKVVNVSAYFNPARIINEDLQWIIDEDGDLAEILADIVNYSIFNQEDKKNGIYSMHRLIQTSIQIYQKANNTDQDYYLLALESVLNNSKSEQSTVFQFANDFEDVILQTYRSYEHKLLLFLINNRCYDALTILFNNCKDNVISNIYSNDLIYLLTVRQDIRMLDLLRKSGVDLNMPNNNGYSLIEIACMNGYINVVKYVLENNISTKIGDTGKTLLHLAAGYAHAQVVLLVLEWNKDLIDEMDNSRYTALTTVISSFWSIPEDRIVDTVRVLLADGASVLVKSNLGQTALHYAAKYGATQVIPLIIAANRDVLDKKDKEGRSALHIAIFAYRCYPTNQVVETVRILIDNGASVLIKDRVGQTPLHYAARHVRPDIIPLIIQSNPAIVHEVDEMGNTALHVLATYNFNNDFENVKVETTINILIRNGLSMHIKNKSNLTPMDIINDQFKHVFKKIGKEKSIPKKKRSIFKRLLTKK